MYSKISIYKRFLTFFIPSILFCLIILNCTPLAHENKYIKYKSENKEFKSQNFSIFVCACDTLDKYMILGDGCRHGMNGVFDLNKNRFVWKKGWSHPYYFPHSAVNQIIGHVATQEARDKTIIRSLLNGNIIASINRLQYLVYSHDGKYLIGNSNPYTLQFLETNTYKIVKTMEVGEVDNCRVDCADYISGISISPTMNQIAVTLEDRTIRIIDINDLKEKFVIKEFDSNAFRILSLYSKDGKYFLVYGDLERGIRLYTLPNYDLLALIAEPYVKNAKISSDGKYLVTSRNNNQIKIWDLSTQKVIGSTQTVKTGCDYDFRNINFSNDNEYISADVCGYLYFWRIDGTIQNIYKFPRNYDFIDIYLIETPTQK